MASDTFIYFENAGIYGAINGIVQVELTANALNPTSDGAVELSVEDVARLRCNVPAALSLIEALSKAVEMAQKPGVNEPQVTKPN